MYSPLPKTLTLFRKTKICNIQTLFRTNTLFQTCLIISSLVQTFLYIQCYMLFLGKTVSAKVILTQLMTGSQAQISDLNGYCKKCIPWSRIYLYSSYKGVLPQERNMLRLVHHELYCRRVEFPFGMLSS